MTSLFLL